MQPNPQKRDSIPQHDPQAFLPERYPLLQFPEEDWDWFVAACRDLEIKPTAEQRLTLEQLFSHLSGVNQWLNLTRLTSPAEYLKFHVFDSLTILNLVQELSAPGDSILDLGSGGGYPGLPLAIWLADRHFILLDSRRKKVEFLRHTITLLSHPQLEADCFRGREVARHRPALQQKCALLTARAVGLASENMLDAAELLKDRGFLLMMKGPNFLKDEGEDFENACRKTGFALQEILPIALDSQDPDRYIVIVQRKAKKRKW
jgi:16S rRNA (guanine527-N7)-methyltransferase